MTLSKPEKSMSASIQSQSDVRLISSHPEDRPYQIDPIGPDEFRFYD